MYASRGLRFLVLPKRFLKESIPLVLRRRWSRWVMYWRHEKRKWDTVSRHRQVGQFGESTALMRYRKELRAMWPDRSCARRLVCRRLVSTRTPGALHLGVCPSIVVANFWLLGADSHSLTHSFCIFFLAAALTAETDVGIDFEKNTICDRFLHGASLPSDAAKAASSASSFPGLSECPGTHMRWMRNLGLAFRIDRSWRWNSSTRYCPGLGAGFAIDVIALWLSRRIVEEVIRGVFRMMSSAIMVPVSSPS